MRALAQSWLCFVVLFALAALSFFAGVSLEFFAHFDEIGLPHFFGNNPYLPESTKWFLNLHSDEGHTLLTASLLPTLVSSAYLWHLLSGNRDPIERLAKFALMTLASIILIITFYITGVTSLALPFIEYSKIMGQIMPTPLQSGVWTCFVILLIINGFAVLRMIISPFIKRRGETSANSL